MKKRTITALVAVILIAVGLVIYFHWPKPKPQSRAGFRQMPALKEFVGVGLMLRMDTPTHAVVIQQVVPGTPAAQAGITNRMLVNRVDDVALAGKPLSECINLIRGPVGSTVQLELITPDGTQTNTVTLTRRKIKL